MLYKSVPDRGQLSNVDIEKETVVESVENEKTGQKIEAVVEEKMSRDVSYEALLQQVTTVNQVRGPASPSIPHPHTQSGQK